MHMGMRRLISGLLVSGLASVVALAAFASVPVPPDQVAYSGVLVDGGGVPLVGPVDLTARLYDAASGGSLVFKQSFMGVALTDGHYALNLGPTGAATDSPTDPLTTSLRTALTGDLAAGAGRFVEITVNSDPPLARVALVLVPYALRADHATTSDIATNALDAQALGGIDPIVLEAVYGAWNFDGGPASTDPSEGTGNPDGDGLVNFVDPDNDNDGLSDAGEVSLGTNINLVTPTISTVSPVSAVETASPNVTVTGTGFLPGLTAAFGTQVFSPSSTSTSFQVTLAPQAPAVLNLLVSNPNGETRLKTSAFTFFVTPPPPPPPPPPPQPADVPLPFAIPSSVSPISISIHGNDETLVYGSQHITGGNAYAIDTLADFYDVLDVSATLVGRSPSALGWNASRVLHGLRSSTATNQIQVLRDANANHLLEDGEAVALEAGTGPYPRSPSLTFDGAGRPAGGYVRTGAGTIVARAFHDRDGNGVFTGTNELVTIETAGSVSALGDAHFDGSGRLAYVFYNSTLGATRVAWDRSGDGDFADTVDGVPELGSAPIGGVPSCLAADFDGSGRLGVVRVFSGSPSLLYDLNADLDFTDPGEDIALPGAGPATGCDITRSAATGRLVIVYNRLAQLHLAVDGNDDGDFADTDEDTLLSTVVGPPLSVATNASGAVRVLSPQGVWLGPVR